MPKHENTGEPLPKNTAYAYRDVVLMINPGASITGDDKGEAVNNENHFTASSVIDKCNRCDYIAIEAIDATHVSSDN